MMGASENNNNHWLFTNEQINNSPSSRDNIDAAAELQLRQYTASFIFDLGGRIKV